MKAPNRNVKIINSVINWHALLWLEICSAARISNQIGVDK